ncbi:MAG: hypothetical protein K9G58_02645 [Bacteroidales bacterium]|nr:hypothetical protein [Bacteroidales bacterium]MCF8397037.1 hypothetical protein [Bacteroidales bacterium]
MKLTPGILIALFSFLFPSCMNSQSKSDFEKNGIKITFTTTQLGTLNENGNLEIIKDMNLAGDFIFIPENKAIVIRHDNGNDELMEVEKISKTPEDRYVFTCNNDRVVFLSPREKIITYSLTGKSGVFVFPVDENSDLDIEAIINKFDTHL